MIDREKEAAAIEEIMENFDFERCRDAMLGLGWKWATDEVGISKTPSLYQMISRARRKLEEVVALKTTPGEFRALAMGGFEASVYHPPGYKNFRVVTLQFIVDEWSNRT